MKRGLGFWVDLALTLLFLALLFGLGIGTIVAEGDGMRSAFTARRRVRDFLDDPADATTWDWFAARVRSLDDYIGDHLALDDRMGELNARFQYALGKRLIQSGDGALLTLAGGQLYKPQTERRDMTAAAREVLSIRDALPSGTPFLFAYAHPGLYEQDQLPGPGYAALDHSNEMADELLSLLEEQGVAALDSREVLRATGLAPAEYLLRTDNHWAARAALEMARAVAEKLRGRGVNPERLSLRNLETRTLSGLFLGTYGQRVGISNVDPDDITLYWPRYPTRIHRRTEYLGERTDVEGEFRESVIRWRYLRTAEGQSWNTSAYFAYGLTEDWDYYQNPDGARCTILLVKDSFSAAMGSFLSLAADEVVAVDLRRSDRSLREWVEQVKPDAVVAAFSLPYLLNEGYAFE